MSSTVERFSNRVENYVKYRPTYPPKILEVFRSEMELTEESIIAEHRTLSCETCHGAAQGHVENPDLKLEKLTFSHCVRCHEASPSRPKWLKQIQVKDHYTGQRCTECHSPHQPNEVP